MQGDPKRNVLAHNTFRFIRSNIVVAVARVNAAGIALGFEAAEKERLPGKIPGDGRLGTSGKAPDYR